MTNSRILLLGVLLSGGAFSVIAAGCGDDTSETTGGTAGSGNASTSTTTTSSNNGGTGASTSSSASTGSSAGGGGAGTGGGAALSCAAYCADNKANCKDNLDQWGETASATQCEDTCATWLPGTAADTSKNTLGCHTYHSGAAAADAATHCIHSGPAGAGECGEPCDNLCELAAAVCKGNDFPFKDDADCKAACAGWATDPVYSAATTSGDTFACRLYHATAAASLPAMHCAHIADDSAACMGN